MSDHDYETLLCGYVAQALEQKEDGKPVDAHVICAAHPELATALEEALGMAAGLPRLQSEARAHDPLLGETLLARYRLESRIGAGASGAVYRAQDLSLGRTVAVKVLQPALLRDDRIPRVLREAQTLASLDHPNVVPIYDRGTSAEGLHFLVMQHLEGDSLAALISTCTEVDAGWVQRCARWGSEIAAGLAAAHAQGIFHRDVKPSNVIVTPDDSALLLDFGIAARAADAALTASGTSLGTPWYMAPEQAAGKVRAEASLDVYGLAATLYHLLALRPPYEGDALSVLARVQRESPPPLAAECAAVPHDLIAIVERGMEREPEQRYAGIVQMEADLRAYLAGLPVSVRPITRMGRIWRAMRLHRARSIAVVTGVGLVASLCLALPAWRENSRQQAHTLKLAKEAGLAPLLTIEGIPEDRPRADLREREEALPILAEIIALEPEDIPPRLTRAALNLDGGDLAAAALDVQQIADQLHSTFFAELARRYREADTNQIGAHAVRIAGLPEPQSDEERFALGFHLLRSRSKKEIQQAQSVLDSVAERYRPARDLNLIALLGVADQKLEPERNTWFQRAHDEALRLEGNYGHKTARTRHAIGSALAGMGRYTDALAPLEEALRLRPDRHCVLQNLGLVHRRLGNLERAEQCLHRAHELKPALWNTVFTLAQVERDRGRFAEALALAKQVPQEGDDGQAWKRARLCADIKLAEALERHQAGQRDPAIALAREALQFLKEARQNGAPMALVERKRKIADGVVGGDADQLLRVYLNDLLLDPVDGQQVMRLARMLPANDPKNPLGEPLREFMLRLAVALLPGSPEPKKELDRQLESRQGR